MNSLYQIFSDSLQTGFVNKSILSRTEYHPELLINQKLPPKKVLSTILQELENCQEFYISVAFVTTGGIATIINTLETLEKKKVKGEFLVSQYLNFTQPKALKRLSQFKNITLKIATSGNAHAKGYIFKHKNHYNLIVGSSNLTAQALSINKEWNLKVSALYESSIVEKVLNEFKHDFKNATHVTPNYIVNYEELYKNQFILNQRITTENPNPEKLTIVPNSMQIDALDNLAKLRAENKNKALIISATGTGKTYLSAFDAKAFNAKKLLFIVHRLNIVKSSLKTFKNVFGEERTMGIYSGELRELECDFVFSTIQTISKTSHLENFAKDHFDYIIIDETHRSGADSYLRLINHFEPEFLLGMTATPERTDGTDIFKLFDHNIAYEIRLNRAMEEDMLSSFHYYGITDLIIDKKEIEKKSDFNLLVSNERVDRILEKANFYGTDNGTTRGLIFCSRKEEATELSILFKARGYRTIALTGDNSETERAKAIELLESDNLSEKIDYIFTVDIFNEGIDIPKINQIIMLRPTESAIIFIQQLGRGLRKVDGKSYLTVIDFIGNYDNNYLIPVALYGDTSYNKDTLRKLVTEGSRMIPGSSTINFDEITHKRIFDSIDKANMRTKRDLVNDYNLLKFKLGRIPMMIDFIEHGSRDPQLYVNYSKSYFNFVQEQEDLYSRKLSTVEKKLLELFSNEINNAKRVEESIILEELIKSESIKIQKVKDLIFEKYSYTINDSTIQSCVLNLNFAYVTERIEDKLISANEIYGIENIRLIDGEIKMTQSFKNQLMNPILKKFLIDNINYSIETYNKKFNLNNFKDGFILYQKYSRKDTFRILNWNKNPLAQSVGGYMISSDKKNCPIFVNYHKEDNISSTTKYLDKFISDHEFEWMSKSKRTINSPDVQAIINAQNKMRLPLFVKKHNGEGTDYYYMGDVKPVENFYEETFIKDDNNKDISVVKLIFKLSTPVESRLFNYLTYVEKQTDFSADSKDSGISKSYQIDPSDISIAAEDPIE